MKLRTTFALAVAALMIGVPVAVAEPGGPYRPQADEVAQPDAFNRYLNNNAPEEQADAFVRYLRNNTPPSAAMVATTAAAAHPDSRAVRPGPTAELEPIATDGRDWTTGAWGVLGGALFMFFAVAGASTIRERRLFVLR